MKICIIGPTYPFRGGISHYTTLLFKYIKKNHPTTFIAFKRQYPQWLYPGETDLDLSEKPIQEEGVVQMLDSLNPFSWWKVAQKIRSIKADLVIIPWWTSFWTIPFFCIIKLIKRGSEAKVLFICHNVKEHESSSINQICTGLILRMGDYHVVHSKEEYDNLKKIVPGSIVIQGFHPTYEDLQGGKYSKESAREKLGVRGRVLLFFGFIRPYKGLINLLTAMPEVLETLGPDVVLMVVGECWEDEQLYSDKIEELGIKEHVLRVNKYVPNEQISLYFSAADLVVIPYSSATGSGILQVAFGCEKPVVATRVGALADDVVDGETGYLVAPDDPKGLAMAIAEFFIEEKSKPFSLNIRQTSDRFSWDRMVDLIIDSTKETQ